MSAPLVTLVLVLGLGVVVVRRRSVAIALVAAQSLALGIGALDLASGRSDDFLVASLVLLTKAAVLPALLLVVMRRTREPRLVAPAAPALVRLAGAGAIALAAAALVPPLGLGDAQVEHSAVALVLVGIAITVARRALVRRRARSAVRPRARGLRRGGLHPAHPRRVGNGRHRAAARVA
jgi:hydrogenase-4 component E